MQRKHRISDNHSLHAKDAHIRKSNHWAGFVATWLLALCLTSSARSQEEQAASKPAEADSTSQPNAKNTEQSFPDLKLPDVKDEEALLAFIKKAKQLRPTTPEQYKAMQEAIRDGSGALLKLWKDRRDTDAYRQAEVDTIASRVMLMAYANPQKRSEIVAEVHDFLKSREKLEIQDVQTGIIAANAFELSPDKRPARDTYALLDKLLTDDDREEMQNLRINLQASVRRLNLLGNKLDLRATDIDGKTVDIGSFAGKYVLVDFFATWCEPCLAEVPRIKKHYEKYRSKGLEVVGVSLDAEDEALRKYVSRAELAWPIIQDSADDPMQTMQMKFGISTLPAVLLLNKEGTVISLEARGAELDRLMQMLFESPTPAVQPKTADDSDETADDNKPKKAS